MNFCLTFIHKINILEVIQTVFRNLNLEFFPDNILFYDAFRYYREDIIKLNSDFYSEEDVQADKNEFIESIAHVVENRRIILLKEIEDIQESFKSIKSGHILTEIEITAIQNAIQKIKGLRELRKRVPSFVYEHFIQQYLDYYHTVCRAWNTKHAVHRNFGYYEPRDIDIYYNGSIVAAGTSIEVNNHDVEIHEKSKNVNFKPYKPPLIIAELKREDVNLKNHYTQIQRYLKKSRCDIGILYNFHDLILFNCQEDQFEINYLNSLNDIESIVFQSDKKVNNDIIEFEKAQNGSFDSFTYLVSKYGSRKLNRVVFKLKKNPEEIAGCFLRVQDDKVYYDLYDDKLPKKQQSFNMQDLERLISIVY